MKIFFKKSLYYIVSLIIWTIILYELLSFVSYQSITDFITKEQNLQLVKIEKQFDNFTSNLKNTSSGNIQNLKEDFVILGSSNNSLISEYIFISAMLAIKEQLSIEEKFNDFEFSKFNYIFKEYQNKGIEGEQNFLTDLDKSLCQDKYFYPAVICSYFYQKDRKEFVNYQKDILQQIEEKQSLLQLNSEEFKKELNKKQKLKKLRKKYNIVV